MAQKTSRDIASMSIPEILKVARTVTNAPLHDNALDAARTEPSTSAEAYCAVLMGLSPDERFEHLRALNGNQKFCDAMQLLPPHLREEFFAFEKRVDLESTLKHPVSLPTLQGLIEKGNESLQAIIANWSEGDEFWYYHAIPGDTGYALVRAGRVVDFCTLEVWCV